MTRPRFRPFVLALMVLLGPGQALRAQLAFESPRSFAGASRTGRPAPPSPPPAG